MTTLTIQEQRMQTIAALRARDGNNCRYPECGQPMDFSNMGNISEGPMQVTIDHWMPQHYCKTEGWTYEQTWELSNLRLMHKKCNAKKGDRVPNPDGTLPERKVRKFRYRRDKRATRVGACVICDNGHNLAYDEVCASCGGDAQAFPRWAKVRYQECDHEISWCIWCSIGDIPRTNPVAAAMRQADSDELGEMFDPDEQ